MSHNRIPRRAFSERDRVLARGRQDAAFRSYAANIRRTEQAGRLLEVRPDLVAVVARLAPTTALIHV